MISSIVSIVDDDPTVRDSTVDLLNSYGYAARGFETAEEFLNSGEVANTCCLITDQQMPGLSGTDLQKCLCAAGYRTPVIFITAYDVPAVRERALAAERLERPLSSIRVASVTSVTSSSSGHAPSHFARTLARAGIQATFSNSRGPDSLKELVQELGPAIKAGTAGVRREGLKTDALPGGAGAKRTTTWPAFIRTHQAPLAGTDFFTVECKPVHAIPRLS